METLRGGRSAIAKFEDPETPDEVVQVRQLPLRDYERAFKLFDDEVGLTALVCGKDKAWGMSLDPKSYEDLHAAAQEVNAGGFFAYAARRQDALVRRINQVSPEMLRAVMEKVSTASPPGLLPRA